MDFSKIDLSENQELAREIVLAALKENPKSRRDFEKLRNKVIKKRKGFIFHNMFFIKAYQDLLKEKKIKKNEQFLSLIRKRGVRTISGVAPVTVLTKPYPCPGKCVYCPNDVRMPKSYLPSQPAAQRAFRQRFDPYTQVFVRLKALKMTGHDVSKVELRIIGGTFSVYDKKYRDEFVNGCLMAMNEFYQQDDSGDFDDYQSCTEKTTITSEKGIDTVNTFKIEPVTHTPLQDSIKINETAKVRCIGVNIETRPDYVNREELAYLRTLGVTKVEMGVQTLDDLVQQISKRGHDSKTVASATKLLKDYGFKVSYHIMPNLPGSTVAKDFEVFKELFENKLYRPDYLKIYPCVVLPDTELEEIYNKGKFSSYSDKEIEDLLFRQLSIVPFYCRVDRIARDIPSDDLVKGFKASNIRQKIEKKIVMENLKCQEIRFREIGADNYDLEQATLKVDSYGASMGEELFISFVSQDNRLLALLRLRVNKSAAIDKFSYDAIIREVHVYGKQVAVGEKDTNQKQHRGLGKRLIKKAEDMVKKRGLAKIAVISGIGTREYYKKLGYNYENTYMVKELR